MNCYHLAPCLLAIYCAGSAPPPNWVCSFFLLQLFGLDQLTILACVLIWFNELLLFLWRTVCRCVCVSSGVVANWLCSLCSCAQHHPCIDVLVAVLLCCWAAMLPASYVCAWVWWWVCCLRVCAEWESSHTLSLSCGGWDRPPVILPCLFPLFCCWYPGAYCPMQVNLIWPLTVIYRFLFLLCLIIWLYLIQTNLEGN
jgi:hypothetical protein